MYKIIVSSGLLYCEFDLYLSEPQVGA